MQIEYVSFNGRDGRASYVVSRFQPLLHGRVLDVGCDTRRIKTLMPDLDYVGIDLGGEPDIRINLEQTQRLPFDDREFQCVVCTDVLEHLDNLHDIFAELVRVCSGTLIISLPNCWNSVRSRLARGDGAIRYYGLPAERPEDRHKWFFNVTDVMTFMQSQAARFDLVVKEFRGNVRPGAANRMRRVLYPPALRYLNRYAHSVWTVLERR